MYKIFAMVIVALLHEGVYAQIDTTKETKGTKYGLKWGGTPALAYDPDLGLKYGAAINLFDYGDGSRFPEYNQYLFLRLLNTTKGTLLLSAVYDSDILIPKTYVTVEAAFMRDIALDFWGFNGVNARYEPDFVDQESTKFIHKKFYSHRREWLRLRFDFQRNIMQSNWKLFGGFTFNNFKISDYDDKSSGQNNVETLYGRYIHWGIIAQNEQNGGIISTLSAGITFDNRNNRIKCTDGVWFESYLVAALPEVSSASFLRQVTTFRHFIHIPQTNILFTYRLSSQQQIAGMVPFYALPVFYDTRENRDGVGGAFTMRGINRNRIVADGFVMGNFELRKNIFNFSILKLNWEVELSAFADFSYITQEYKFPVSGIPQNEYAAFFKNRPQQVNTSFGPGIYLMYNHNNIISINYGFSGNKQLGNSGLYIGSTFLF
jgi:outer membrane protein assembly factor BamA